MHRCHRRRTGRARRQRRRGIERLNMRVSLNWLREFLAPEVGRLSREQAAEALTMAGLTVEGSAAAEGDALLDLELTTNRPDALGHYGVARDLGAALGIGLRPLSESQPRIEESGAAAGDRLTVRIEAEADCARYCARVIEGMTPGPAPTEVTARLELLGQRAINNAADLTNYTLLETGQPTHAFDADTLEGGEIRVRRARAGETLVTLDEVERRLDPEDLVIADARRPVALAGVMGGLATAIGAKTRRVVIESAWFEPTRIRRTAQRHGLHTDASHRFERGADPEICGWVADRIAARLRAAAGGTILQGRIDVYPRRWEAPRITLWGETVRRLLGVEIGEAEARRILTALGMTVEQGGVASGTTGGRGWKLNVAAPSWRPDLQEEVDLVEEVARIHGYGRFPARLPSFAGGARRTESARAEERIRTRLRAQGYAEAVALSFAAESECRALGGERAPVPVAIQHPISEEAAVMRTSALPAMLHLLLYNLNRGQAEARLFEIGKAYGRVGPAVADADRREPRHWVEERRVVTLGAAGRAEPIGWAQSGRTFDFYDLKAAVKAVLEGFGTPNLEIVRLADPAFHPGRGAAFWLKGRRIARFGQLHPERAAEWKLKVEAYLAEIDLEPLLALGPREAQYAPPPKYPASERDFSFLFTDEVSWAQVRQAVTGLNLAALAELTPIEVFRGGSVPSGQYSLLLRARFQLADRTLREEEVGAHAERILGALTALGGTQR